jgi:hypothetical protein
MRLDDEHCVLTRILKGDHGFLMFKLNHSTLGTVLSESRRLRRVPFGEAFTLRDEFAAASETPLPV